MEQTLIFHFAYSHVCSSSPGVAPKAAALRALYEGKKIIVARDKLDVVKGVVQKVLVGFTYHQRPSLTGIVVLAPRL